MNNVGIIAGVATLVVSLIGLFIAVRSEIKNQQELAISERLEDEKRHARIEFRLQILETKTAGLEGLFKCFDAKKHSELCTLLNINNIERENENE